MTLNIQAGPKPYNEFSLLQFPSKIKTNPNYRTSAFYLISYVYYLREVERSTKEIQERSDYMP